MNTDANNAAVNTGSVWAPYQEFEYVIPAGQYQRVEYVTDNFVLLETTTQGALEVNFGGAVNQTNFTTGIQYKLQSPVANIQLYNKSNAPLRVHFALGVGEVKDNRLSVYGALTAYETYTSMTVERKTLTTGANSVGSAQRKIIIQNTGTDSIFIGAADGFEVSAGGSIDINLSGAVDVYGAAGQSIVVGLFD